MTVMCTFPRPPYLNYNSYQNHTRRRQPYSEKAWKIADYTYRIRYIEMFDHDPGLTLSDLYISFT